MCTMFCEVHDNWDLFHIKYIKHVDEPHQDMKLASIWQFVLCYPVADWEDPKFNILIYLDRSSGGTLK